MMQNNSLLMAVFFAMLLPGLVACGGGDSSGNSADSNQATEENGTSDGETSDGETSDGETSDGETSDGETSDGDTSDGGTADNNAPVITLVGDAELQHAVGEEFVDPGATVSDDVDSDLQANVSGSVDSSQPGTYILRYTAQDSAGNQAEPVARTINVVDLTPPVVQPVGDYNQVVLIGQEYVDRGATASDNVDGDITNSISREGTVDTSTAGVYSISYLAQDSAGNEGEASIAVEVKPPNYSFQLLDNDLTLYEGDYRHKFIVELDEAEAVEKTIQVSVSANSTANQGSDFSLNQDAIEFPENAKQAFIDLQVFHVPGSQGARKIDLELTNDFGLDETVSITLTDATKAPEKLSTLSNASRSPMVTVVDDILSVAYYGRLEVYDLVEETSVAAKFSTSEFPFLEYGDAVAYDGERFIYVEGSLYKIDVASLTSELISTSPQYLEKTSELQVLDDELYIVAGGTEFDNSSTTVIAYNFASDEWVEKPSLNRHRYGAATAVVDGKLYVFGGNYGGGTAEVFDPSVGYWQYVASTPTTTYSMDTAAVIGRHVFVAVSETSSNLVVMRYDTQSNSWDEFTTDTPSRKYQDSFLYKGKMHLVGGTDNAGYSGAIVSFYIGEDYF